MLKYSAPPTASVNEVPIDGIVTCRAEVVFPLELMLLGVPVGTITSGVVRKCCTRPVGSGSVSLTPVTRVNTVVLPSTVSLLSRLLRPADVLFTVTVSAPPPPWIALAASMP